MYMHHRKHTATQTQINITQESNCCLFSKQYKSSKWIPHETWKQCNLIGLGAYSYHCASNLKTLWTRNRYFLTLFYGEILRADWNCIYTENKKKDNFKGWFDDLMNVSCTNCMAVRGYAIWICFYVKYSTKLVPQPRPSEWLFCISKTVSVRTTDLPVNLRTRISTNVAYYHLLLL